MGVLVYPATPALRHSALLFNAAAACSKTQHPIARGSLVLGAGTTPIPALIAQCVAPVCTAPALTDDGFCSVGGTCAA
ncbi:hypothetical protein GQ54DRAFT_296462 [Martensiomyces pterosporus]|nr:hypothetical protein GQ54DRAFT_296462 [Martensiomyces pterosporus]